MKSRDKSLISLAVLAVIALAGYFLLVQPKHHQAHQLAAQIVSAQSGLSNAEAEVEADLRTEAQYKTYVKQLKTIRTAVPGDAQIPELINQLQAASTRNQIGFQAVSVASSSASTAGTASTSGTGTTSATFPSQSFNLTFTGNYFSVARLLGSLAGFVQADDKHFHASGRLISISTLSLSPGGTGPSTGQTGPGVVTAAVTALDYDVPTSLLPTSPTAASSSTSTSTASPAAYVSP